MVLAKRTIRPPLDPREWLEDMRRFNGRDADFATRVLASLDDAPKQVERLETLDVWAERDATFKDFGELDEETIERFARAYDQLQDQAWALQALCVEAGLLNPNDHTTDPLPLLRMFLPVGDE